MSLSSELQAVVAEGVKAQELEDNYNPIAAAESYYTAACRLQYLLDVQLEKCSPLADVCSSLMQAYQHRFVVLRDRQAAADEAQCLQLDPQGNSAASSAMTGTAFVHITGPATALQASSVAAGSAGVNRCNRSVSPEQSAGRQQESTTAMELLRLCQRSVSGSLDDVVGLDDVKDEIEEAIFMPLQHPYLFKGVRQPARTFLLYGPPGTGKTMLVEKVAAEAKFSLLSVSPSVILSKWSGDSEKAISQVFELAKSMQPSILFLDEVDSLGQSRGSDMEGCARRLLTELLLQFNRAAEEDSLYIFAATNRLQDCDTALLRRFNRRIPMPLPSVHDRQCFFDAVLATPELESELSQADVEMLAQQTAGYTSSDLAAVCRQAAMEPVRELLNAERHQQQQHRGVKRRRLRLRQLIEGSTSDADSVLDAGHGHAAVGNVAAAEGVHSAAAGDLPMQKPAVAAVDGGQLQLRKLVLADFTAALDKIKPAASDVKVAAMAGQGGAQD